MSSRVWKVLRPNGRYVCGCAYLCGVATMCVVVTIELWRLLSFFNFPHEKRGVLTNAASAIVPMRRQTRSIKIRVHCVECMTQYVVFRMQLSGLLNV